MNNINIIKGERIMKLIVFAPVGATLALLFAAYYTYTVFKIDEGTDKMKYIQQTLEANH